jgi:hypothetical protein
LTDRKGGQRSLGIPGLKIQIRGAQIFWFQDGGGGGSVSGIWVLLAMVKELKKRDHVFFVPAGGRGRQLR